jgi:hypothetical protein
MADKFVPLVNIEAGWQDRQFSPNADGFSVMENAILTERGGVAVRPGTELFGVADTTNGPVYSMHTAKLKNGTNIQLRSSDTVLEFYNPLTSAWETLKTGFTTSLVFGFQDHSRGKIAGSIDNNSYTYFCNAVEPYQRWRNEAYDATTAVLAGGEAYIPVNTIFTTTVFYSGTASATTTTTLSIASAEWFANQWNTSFYVYITSGAAAGETRVISATTTTQISFSSIGTLAGTPTFEIRMVKFPASGSVIVGGTIVAYTAFTSATRLTVASAPAKASGTSVALVPEEIKSAPRGNILATLFTQMFLSGNKRFPTTLYRAKIDDATDFTFSATRVAGEGDVIDIPDAAPKINDVSVFEDKIIVGSESYVESVVFTQDANDLPNRTPLLRSSLAGPSGRASRIGDDFLFTNKNGDITTFSRLVNKDVRASTQNVAWDIDRAIRNYDLSDSRAFTSKNYTFVATKESEDSLTNDSVLVRDNTRGRWVGKWNLPAQCFTEYNNEVYFGSSASREVYKMMTATTVQTKGTDLIGYTFRAATQWINKTSDKSHSEQFDTLKVGGFVKLNTPITFRLYYDFSLTASKEFTWDPQDNPTCILGLTEPQVLGVTYLGSTPLGVEGSEDIFGDFGEVPFLTYIKIDPKAHNYVKLEIETDGENQYVEVTELAANITELPNLNEALISNFEA